MPSETPEAETATPDYVADSVMGDQPKRAQKISMGSNSKFSVTAGLSVSRDDNVFLTSPTAESNGKPISKTSDTIIALTPGVDYTFGQDSLAHGSVSYKNAITRYMDKSSPNVALSNAAADFGYDSGSTAVLGSASFQQLNQNNSTVAALGQQEIIRQDLLGLSASVEPHLTAKTSLKTGLNYTDLKYKTDGLIGSQDTEVPLKIYLEATPKVSVSAGVSYRRSTPQNDGSNAALKVGPSSKDWDYNIGARGNFTAKLSGEFSLDYRTRTVGTTPKERENLWGFNGNLQYEITPKTTSSLVFTRDFNIGALGQSLKNSSYALRFSSDPSPQWQLGAELSFRQAEYGPYAFRLNNTSTQLDRNDKTWDANVQATYLFRSWLSLTAGYTFRHNSSTLADAEYNDNILSLILGWQY